MLMIEAFLKILLLWGQQEGLRFAKRCEADKLRLEDGATQLKQQLQHMEAHMLANGLVVASGDNSGGNGSSVSINNTKNSTNHSNYSDSGSGGDVQNQQQGQQLLHVQERLEEAQHSLRSSEETRAKTELHGMRLMQG